MPWPVIRIVIAVLVGTPVSLYLSAALQTGPDQSDLHLCELLRRFNPAITDHCVPRLWDSSGIVIAALVCLACLFVVIFESRAALSPIARQQRELVKNAIAALNPEALQWLRESHVAGRPKSEAIAQALNAVHLIDRDFVGWTEVKPELKPLVAKRLRSYDAWKRVTKRASHLEPVHIIILGLVIAAFGVGWQMYRADSLSGVHAVQSATTVTVTANKIPAPPPEIVANIKAPLEAEIAALRKQIEETKSAGLHTHPMRRPAQN
jgi:hypothetical protein